MSSIEEQLTEALKREEVLKEKLAEALKRESELLADLEAKTLLLNEAIQNNNELRRALEKEKESFEAQVALYETQLENEVEKAFRYEHDLQEQLQKKQTEAEETRELLQAALKREEELKKQLENEQHKISQTVQTMENQLESADDVVVRTELERKKKEALANQKLLDAALLRETELRNKLQLIDKTSRARVRAQSFLQVPKHYGK